MSRAYEMSVDVHNLEDQSNDLDVGKGEKSHKKRTFIAILSSMIVVAVVGGFIIHARTTRKDETSEIKLDQHVNKQQNQEGQTPYQRTGTNRQNSSQYNL